MTRRRAGPPAPQPRVASRSRAARRAVAKGGEGMAERLNLVLAGWDGVRVTPTFGRWGYFVGGELFGCFPVKPKAHDLWIRLSRSEQARALQAGGVRPHRRFGGRGWVECDVTDLESLGVGLRWLRRAFTQARQAAAREGQAGPGPPVSPPPGPPTPPGA